MLEVRVTDPADLDRAAGLLAGLEPGRPRIDAGPPAWSASRPRAVRPARGGGRRFEERAYRSTTWASGAPPSTTCSSR